MALLNLELFSTDKQKEIIDNMPLADRARIKHWPDYLAAKEIYRFPDYLSIEEISDLLFPIFVWPLTSDGKSSPVRGVGDPKSQVELNRAFKDQLIDACIKGKLPYKGTIPIWHYPKNKKPHPLAKKGCKDGDSLKMINIGGAFASLQPGVYAKDCTIHKNEFKQYFKSTGQWALVNKGLLAGWWVDDAGETSKPLKGTPLKKLKDLAAYFKDQETWDFPKGEVRDKDGAYYFPYTIERLLVNMEKWEKTIKKRTGKEILWDTKEMDKIMWNHAERKAICYGNGRGHTKKTSQN